MIRRVSTESHLEIQIILLTGIISLDRKKPKSPPSLSSNQYQQLLLACAWGSSRTSMLFIMRDRAENSRSRGLSRRQMAEPQLLKSIQHHFYMLHTFIHLKTEQSALLSILKITRKIICQDSDFFLNYFSKRMCAESSFYRLCLSQGMKGSFHSIHISRVQKQHPTSITKPTVPLMRLILSSPQTRNHAINTDHGEKSFAGIGSEPIFPSNNLLGTIKIVSHFQKMFTRKSTLQLDHILSLT